MHPVDEVLPAPKLFAPGLQHVLVLYAGAVAVPLIIGRALKLPPELGPILHSDILLAAVSLNLFFNGAQDAVPSEEVVLPPPAGSAGLKH